MSAAVRGATGVDGGLSAPRGACRAFPPGNPGNGEAGSGRGGAACSHF